MKDYMKTLTIYGLNDKIEKYLDDYYYKYKMTRTTYIVKSNINRISKLIYDLGLKENQYKIENFVEDSTKRKDLFDELSTEAITTYITRYVNTVIYNKHSDDEFKLDDVKLKGNTAIITYHGTMKEEVANKIVNQYSLNINGKDYRTKLVRDKNIVDSRADVLEATVVHIANELYKKKDKLGLGLSQKELDEIITNINYSSVFKRFVEQAVRNWIKEQENINV